MGKTKHEKTFVDFDQPYEQNVVGMRGILYFGLGLFLLIVVTFGLMWVFQYKVLEKQADDEDRANKKPLAMTSEEQLPPEPRLQAAPGFGVDSENGRVDLQLKAPSSEYQELRARWEKEWKDGQKDPKTGTVVSLSVDEAKKKFLEENVKARTGEAAEKAFEDARTFYAYSSSGRTRSDKRR